MSRTAVLAVAAAVVLLGTVQVATRPERVPDPLTLSAQRGDQALMSSWATVLQDGTPRGPLPLASSISAGIETEPVWLTSDGFGYLGTDAVLALDMRQLTSPYTQIAVSPTGQVLAVCVQRVKAWVPPCLPDAVAQAW